MNRRVLAVGLLLTLPLLGVLVAGLGRDLTVRSPLVGRPAPAFSLRPVGGGTPIGTAELRGQPAVVNFWATWCVPCYQEHGVLTRAARALDGRVRFLGVVYEDAEENVQRFLQEHGGGYPSLLDEESRTAIAYGVFGVPETYFLDANGTVVGKHIGPLDDRRLQAELVKAGLQR
ncbi:MAG TPA: redoxin domain-containing protein [Vicinamibacteria bacterium]|nr:redoxin domain-containing protein [Vicinamibacteria bacterium]